MKKQTWIIIGCIVAAAVLFGGLGYWAGHRKTATTAVIPTPPVPPVPEVSATVTPSATATKTADVTANWKTYTNDTYGLSVKYPSGWKATVVNQPLAPINGNEIVELSNTTGQIDVEEGMTLSFFYSTDMSKYPDVNKILSDDLNSKSQDTETSASISSNGFEGVITRAKEPGRTYTESAELYKKTTSGFVETKWSSTDPNNKNYTFENYAAPILSTFQFTK
jgi:hypothetical protein